MSQPRASTSTGRSWSYGFMQAVGLRPTFRPRRSVFGGGSSTIFIFNILVATGLGIVSGQYIFKEPLEQYWKEHGHILEEERLKEKQQKEQQQQQQK